MFKCTATAALALLAVAVSGADLVSVNTTSLVEIRCPSTTCSGDPACTTVPLAMGCQNIGNGASTLRTCSGGAVQLSIYSNSACDQNGIEWRETKELGKCYQSANATSFTLHSPSGTCGAPPPSNAPSAPASGRCSSENTYCIFKCCAGLRCWGKRGGDPGYCRS